MQLWTKAGFYDKAGFDNRTCQEQQAERKTSAFSVPSVAKIIRVNP